MVIMMQKDISFVISAEAILKTKSGRSLAHADVAITKENVEEFTPASETVTESKRLFQKLGFTVSQAGITLTIIGKPEQFEKVFKVKLNIKKDEPTGGIIVNPEGELEIPNILKGLVEKVVFPEPPEFFP